MQMSACFCGKLKSSPTYLSSKIKRYGTGLTQGYNWYGGSGLRSPAIPHSPFPIPHSPFPIPHSLNPYSTIPILQLPFHNPHSTIFILQSPSYNPHSTIPILQSPFHNPRSTIPIQQSLFYNLYSTILILCFKK